MKRELAHMPEQVGLRAENVFKARGFCCSESVLFVLNQALGGGLAPDVAVRLGSGFCHGMGGASCVCGALAGGQMVLGLFLGPTRSGMKKKEFQKVSQALHDRFKERFGATCCHLLLQRHKEKRGVSCRELTGGGAEITAGLLLAHRPEVAVQADWEFLQARDAKPGALLKKPLGKRPAA